MSTQQSIARILLTIVTLAYGLVTAIIDVSDTHVLHPDWSVHARFHTVWMIATFSLIACYMIYLLWFSSLAFKLRAQIVLITGLCINLGFLVSTFTRSLYGGALADLHGGVAELAHGLDANLVAIIVSMIMLLVAGKLLSTEKI